MTKLSDVFLIGLLFLSFGFLLFGLSARAQFLEPTGSAYESVPQSFLEVASIGQISKEETGGVFQISTHLDPPCMGYTQTNFESDGSYERIEYACVLQEISRSYTNAPIASSTSR